MPQINDSQQNTKDASASQGYPNINLHNEDIFVVIKTYPRPHRGLKETVCTAGITKKGKWIRLFPLDFRYLPGNQKFIKYQWIKVDIKKNDKDIRKDTYCPITSSIRLGDAIPSRNYNQRSEIIIPSAVKSLEELQSLYEKDKISLGVFRPKKILDFKIEKDQETWKPKHQQILRQKALFGRQPKKLDKIPYKFSYIFRCNDKRCNKNHSLSIIDWEICQLYRNLKEKNGYDMSKILEGVKKRWFVDMWDKNRNSYLIVGTQFRWSTWMVLGVFWPPKD